MPPYVGIEIYFGPTGKARDIWKASNYKPILHRKGRLSAVTGMYFVFQL